MPAKICSCGEPTGSKANKCPPCHNAYMKDWRERKRKEGVTTHDVYNYKWREKNPEKYMYQNAKSSAKKRGLEFTIRVEDIVIPTHCPVFGVELELVVGSGTKDNKPSLDRIDSSKGYVKGNIQVISWRANNLKSDGRLEEFIKLVEFMKNGD